MRNGYGIMGLAVLVSMLMLGGCGKPPVLDGNSEERFENSVTLMLKDCPAEKQEKIKAAIQLIRTKDTAQWRERGEPEAAEIARVQMTGMTAEDVLKKAAGY